MLTSYDYTMAQIVDGAGMDVILVGDSASNVMAGNVTTLPITLDQMIYHAKSVVRGVKRAMVVVDMPFGSYQGNEMEGLASAIRIMKESHADALKLEGGEEIIGTVKRILSAGIPIMGHLGLMPQSINKYGTYTVRAKDDAEAEKLVRDAHLLEEAGCFALVLEKIPAALAERVAGELTIPVIGIGAGSGVDGQVLVVQDMLGMVQERFGVDLSSATKVLDDSEAMVKEIYSMASAAMPQIVASIGSVASNFVAIFTSIAASIYMLADKEHLLHQLRTLAHAFLPEKAAENTLRICHYANVNFTGFFVGKIIDSAIIGVITFVAMAILRLDFALLISVFIGITNIIPVFGPFIGAIPSIFILLLVDPIQAVIFGVLILVIQQVDGNFIGPKILGSSIGISALWILFSIVVGGDLFGLVGMVVGVPLFATFYGLAREFVHYMLDKRGLDSEGNHVGEVVEDEENVFE